MPLSDIQARNAKPKTGEYELSDGGGLYLRVLRAEKGGGKYWVFRYRIGKRRRKMGLGVYSNAERPLGGGVALKTARELAKKYRDQVALGTDPLESKQNRAAAETVQALFDRWKEIELSFHQKKDGRSYDGRRDGGHSAEIYFNRHISKSLGKRDADTVTEEDVTGILRKLVTGGKHRTARILYGELRQMFAYALANKIIKKNPADGVPDVYRGKAAAKRERVLSPDELRDLARKLLQSGLPEKYQAAVWIMLATSCRVGELSKAKWSDVNLDKGEWRIPPENSKTNEEYLVHLSDFAVRQFAVVLKAKDGRWIFPGIRSDEPISSQAIQKILKELSLPVPPKGRKKIIEAAGKKIGSLVLSGGTWSAHDLRRTSATLMSELGVPPHITEKCLNHKLAGVMAVYQKQNLFPERRHAFRILGEALERAQRGKPIIPDEMGDVVPIWAARPS